MLATSRPLILDPLSGHPESSLHVTNPNLRGTIKELAQLDGGFVVSGEGVFRSACPYPRCCGRTSRPAAGTRQRHIAAANMSAVTSAVGIVVSESSLVRLFCHGQLVGEIIPEVWMLDHAHLGGAAKREQVGELTILTPSLGQTPSAKNLRNRELRTVLSEFPHRIPNQWMEDVGRAIQNAHNAKEKKLKVL